MNIFELSSLISLSAGPILGGVAGKPFGILGSIGGAVGGLLIAFACHFTVLGLSDGLHKLGLSYEAPPKKWFLFIPSWIADFTAVIIMALSPVSTILILTWLKEMLKQ